MPCRDAGDSTARVGRPEHVGADRPTLVRQVARAGHGYGPARAAGNDPQRGSGRASARPPSRQYGSQRATVEMGGRDQDCRGEWAFAAGHAGRCGRSGAATKAPIAQHGTDGREGGAPRARQSSRPAARARRTGRLDRRHGPLFARRRQRPGILAASLGGRPWAPDRVKDGDRATTIPHLLWGVVGTIQPDRVAGQLLAGDDDGLAARFLYAWPATVPPRRPSKIPDNSAAQLGLASLVGLEWQPPDLVLLPFTEDAAVILRAWREEAANLEEGAAGMFLSWLGKLPGLCPCRAD